jgi:hypothetical protein
MRPREMTSETATMGLEEATEDPGEPETGEHEDARLDSSLGPPGY